MTLSECAGKLHKAKAKEFKAGSGFIACCPSHEDKNPSFAVWESDDHWLHFKCQRGCSEDDILSALGMVQDDRRTTEYDQGKPPKPPEKTYIYEDENGTAIFQKIRYSVWNKGKWEKSFRQVGVNGETNLSHLNGKSKTMFHLCDVRKAIETGQTIYVNEGEKACEIMEIAGFTATCQPGGADGKSPASKWLPQHTQALKGAAKVVIVADRDDVGEAYAKYVASQLSGIVGAVVIVQSATENAKADAFDHFEAGFNAEQFVIRLDLMPKRGLATRKIEDYESVEPKFLFGRHIRLGQLNLLDGDGGLGKSTLCLALAASGSNGYDPIDDARIEPFRTLYFGQEDEGGDLKAVYRHIGGKDGFCEVWDEPFRLDDEGIRQVLETVQDGKFRLVVFDALMYYMQGLVKDSSDMMGAVRVLTALRQVAIQTGCAMLSLRHTAKATLGKLAADLGIGSVQFRNSHRSQLVMRWHPDRINHPCLRVVTHEKGSIRNATAEPFGFDQRGGQFSWVRDIEDPFASQGLDGKQPSKGQEAGAWLKAVLTGQYVAVDVLMNEARAAGFAERTMERARKAAGVQTVKNGHGGWLLHLPDASAPDPFEEDE